MSNFNWNIFHWSSDYWHMTWESLGVIGLVITIYLAIKPPRTRLKLRLSKYNSDEFTKSIIFPDAGNPKTNLSIFKETNIEDSFVLIINNKSRKDVKIKKYYLEFLGHHLKISFVLKRSFQIVFEILKTKPTKIFFALKSLSIFFDSVRMNGSRQYSRVVYNSELLANKLIPENELINLSEADFIEIPFSNYGTFYGSILDISRVIQNVRIRGVAIDGQGKRYISNMMFVTDEPIYRYSVSNNNMSGASRYENLEQILDTISIGNELPSNFKIDNVKVEKYEIKRYGNLDLSVIEYTAQEFTEYCKNKFPEIYSKYLFQKK